MNGDPQNTQRSETDDERGQSRRRFLSTTALIGGMGVSLTDAVDAETFAEAEAVHDRAEVRFTNQTGAGDRVVVDTVLVSLGGFVAIHDARLFQGQAVESVIGVSDVLEPGEHNDVMVPLFRDVPGAQFDQSALSQSQLLVAMPHFDADESGSYDFVTSGGVKDGPYLTNNQPVIDAAFAALGAGAEFQNQASDGSSVTVQQATLPQGGFVAIHDATLLEGQVVESVVGVSEALDAGRHGDVDVDLYTGVPGAQFDQDSLQDDQPLIAMPHMDTNGNGTYDFVESGGQEDGAYTEEGQAVIDVGFVTVDGGGDDGGGDGDGGGA